MDESTIDFAAKTQLVDTLLACPTIRDRNTRNQIVEQLTKVRVRIPRSETDHIDVANIVNRALDFPNGLAQLIEVLRFYEGDSRHIQNVNAWYKQHATTHGPFVKDDGTHRASETPNVPQGTQRPLRIFLCHASGDKADVRNLYEHLRLDGMAPWLDEKDILPGQDWQWEIPQAVCQSDVVLVALSHNALNTEGYIREEIRYALDAAKSLPLGTIYIIPLKLEECEVPSELARRQWVNLFDENGYERLIKALAVRARELNAKMPIWINDVYEYAQAPTATQAGQSNSVISDTATEPVAPPKNLQPDVIEPIAMEEPSGKRPAVQRTTFPGTKGSSSKPTFSVWPLVKKLGKLCLFLITFWMPSSATIKSFVKRDIIRDISMTVVGILALYLFISLLSYIEQRGVAIEHEARETREIIAIETREAIAISTSVTEAEQTVANLEAAKKTAREIEDITYVYVPAGEFIMGSEDGPSDEIPQHTVDLESYWIMQTEVTNAQYGKFMDASGYTSEDYWHSEGWAWRVENRVFEPRCWGDSNLNGPQQPVVCISWYEADAYAKWLSVRTGLDFGLPTETQWEKAARGSDGRIYPWGNQWDQSKVNSSGNDDGYQYTAPVGSYPTGASVYGALDMSGNVWEWTADWYDSNYYERSSSGNLIGPESGDRRVLRGGSWIYSPHDVRAASRFRFNHVDWNNNVGFRLRLSSSPD